MCVYLYFNAYIYMQIYAYIGVFWLAFGLVLYHTALNEKYSISIHATAITHTTTKALDVVRAAGATALTVKIQLLLEELLKHWYILSIAAYIIIATVYTIDIVVALAIIDKNTA